MAGLQHGATNRVVIQFLAPTLLKFSDHLRNSSKHRSPSVNSDVATSPFYEDELDMTFIVNDSTTVLALLNPSGPSGYAYPDAIPF